MKLLNAIFYLMFISLVNGAATSGGADDGEEDPIEVFQGLILGTQSEDVAYRKEAGELFGRRRETLLARLGGFSRLKARADKRVDAIGREDSSDQESILAALLDSEASPAEKGAQIRLLEITEGNAQAIKAEEVAKLMDLIEALDRIITTIQEELRRLPV